MSVQSFIIQAPGHIEQRPMLKIVYCCNLHSYQNCQQLPLYAYLTTVLSSMLAYFSTPVNYDVKCLQYWPSSQTNRFCWAINVNGFSRRWQVPKLAKLKIFAGSQFLLEMVCLKQLSITVLFLFTKYTRGLYLKLFTTVIYRFL